MKEQRARDAAQAMQDHQADKLAIRAKSERLRALRLAQEAGKPAAKPAKRGAKADRSA